jgi:transcriptional regulator with XRE-family HTH domain
MDMMTIAEKIKQRRLKIGLSQDDVADKLGISRPTYIAVESGKKQLTVAQLRQLASIISSSLEELIFDTMQISTGDFGIEKYKQIILNCLQYGSDSDGKITKTKLAKLAYLVDFKWFYDNLQPLSGLAYRRIPHGPVPDQYFRVIDELYESGAITIENKGTAFMIKANENAPTSQLKEKEINIIKDVSERWKDRNTQEIEDFTHEQLPWKICRAGELIPYELITQEDPENVC